MNTKEMDRIIDAALTEDIGWGDITTESTVSADKRSKGKLIAKESGILCGIQVFKRTMELVDINTKVSILCDDGKEINKGDVIAEIEGLSRSILMAERVSLNFLQHMSGIATATAKLVKQVEGTKAKITDTRKTIPGIRMFEKYAVRVGGGRNHRYCLADGVLIKDNHIHAAGSITNAVSAARNVIPHTVKIEVETENLDMIKEALEVKADIIMLDNMSVEQMEEAVKFIDGRALTEASGNMGDKNLREVAETGVDIISIGAITHSVKAMDISLRFQ